MKLHIHVGSGKTKVRNRDAVTNDSESKANGTGIRVGEKVHVGHKTPGGAGGAGVVTKIDGDYIYIRNEEGILFRGLLKNATRVRDTESKEELGRKLDKLQDEIEKAEDKGNGPTREQLKERERLQKAIREVKDAISGSQIAREIAKDVANCGQRCVRAKTAFREDGNDKAVSQIKQAEDFLDKAYDILRTL